VPDSGGVDELKRPIAYVPSLSRNPVRRLALARCDEKMIIETGCAASSIVGAVQKLWEPWPRLAQLVKVC
jgi:hypothetical protein